jgi:hypothetical protein
MGLMKACTMGLWCRAVSDVSQHCAIVSLYSVTLFSKTHENALRSKYIAHHLGNVAKELGSCIFVIWNICERLGQRGAIQQVQDEEKTTADRGRQNPHDCRDDRILD